MPSRPPHITYTSAPELGAEIDGLERLLHRVPADCRVVGGERAVLEHRLAEQVGGGHRHLHAGLVERRTELLDDALALGCGRTERHQVVVVEVHSVRAEFGKRCTLRTGSSGGRVSKPNGSRPVLPTVQRPNVKWCSGCGV
jgi:hypothetical protein